MDKASTALKGAMAGGVATGVMSAVMFAARSAGLMGEMPPEKITAHALEHAGVTRDEGVQDILASALHFGFGAGAGVLYALVDEGLDVPGPALLKGAVFGTAVWAVSYAGWVPALGIMAMPQDDQRGRPQVMLAAHWFYGVALAGILDRV